MPAPTRDDAERLLRFIGEAESLGGDEPFTEELLAELGQLVQADWVTYCELDRVRRRFLGTVRRPGDNEDDGDDDERIFWDVVCNEHPVCVRHQQGSFSALRLSDFLSLRELHGTRLYDVWFRPLGVDHELNVAIPSPLWHTKTFLFDRRGKSGDFTERDRLILDLFAAAPDAPLACGEEPSSAESSAGRARPRRRARRTWRRPARRRD